jgi:hypothetical protein
MPLPHKKSIKGLGREEVMQARIDCFARVSRWVMKFT